METNDTENKPGDIFGISVTAAAAANLRAAAVWGKVMAIAGFCSAALLIIEFVRLCLVDSDFGSLGGYTLTNSFYSVVTIALLFFMYLFLYRHAVKMLAALDAQSQEMLSESFGQLKAYFRFIGILFIVTFVATMFLTFFMRFV
ncbi:MAG: hypothetical protein ABIX01_10615 [Chitinophagaceae bacterium]